jgi:hypothetical protein
MPTFQNAASVCHAATQMAIIGYVLSGQHGFMVIIQMLRTIATESAVPFAATDFQRETSASLPKKPDGVNGYTF